jgi:threonine dehydrogenase-like Zn-dependent dehydrogenase
VRSIFVDTAIPRLLAVRTLRPILPGIVWSPISSARVQDLPDPALPGPRWIRVRNRQCGICGTDLSLLLVKGSPRIGPAALPANRRIFLGHEVVSDVVEVGKDVTRFRVGDRVVMQSRHAGRNCYSQEIDPPCRSCAQGQVQLCENASLGVGPEGVGGGWSDGYTAHETEVYGVPDDLDDDQAIFVEPMAIAVHAVLRRRPQPGDRVLVIGAGKIGLLTAQAAKAVEPGAKVTILARYPHQEQAAKRLGIDSIVRGGDLYAELAEIAGAKHYRAPMNRGMWLGGFEVVYDCVGSPTTIIDALRWARADGTVVMVGFTLGELKVDLNPIWYQEVDLRGSAFFGMEHWEGRLTHTYDIVVDMIRDGRLQCAGMITHRFPFSEYKQAIATATEKRSGSIQVVLSLAEPARFLGSVL